jgi:diketogulonate reductase-like aldo/keto reductase
MISFCKEHGIQFQAYSALARNKHSSSSEFGLLTKKYNKSAAQILIRYSLQKGWTPVVKATGQAHLESNADVDDFTISESDMSLLNSWDKQRSGSIRMCLT